METYSKSRTSDGQAHAEFDIADGGLLIKYNGCSASVVIPHDVVRIGNDAFRGCYTLESVTITAGVVGIGDYAFAYCDNLAKVHIPAKVTHIGRGAFCSCGKLADISVSDTNATYRSIRGNVYSKDGTRLVMCASSRKTLKVPLGVTGIDSYALLGCRELTEVQLPHTLARIGSGAFELCVSLRSIIVPSMVQAMGSGVFANCINLHTINVCCSKSRVDSCYGLWLSDCTAVVYYDYMVAGVPVDCGSSSDTSKGTAGASREDKTGCAIWIVILLIFFIIGCIEGGFIGGLASVILLVLGLVVVCVLFK